MRAGIRAAVNDAGLILILLLIVWPKPLLAQAEMTIGVLAFRGQQDALERWSPTAEYLSERVADYRFRIVPLTLEGMYSHVEQDRLDFILTNTGHYVMLENAFGISRLATLKARHLGTDFTQFGAVIFTRHDHPQLRELEDIAGHRMLAVSDEAFGGFQMAWRELIDAGIDPFRDLKELRFSGFPQDDIVHAVIAGEVDLGTVRSGTLERMAADRLIDPARIRVLGARQSPSFPFLHSTRLYPEWPFAKARKTSAALAQRVAIALLAMEPESAAARSAFAAGWTIPLDYGPVHELFKQLGIGPYADLGKPSLASVWREFKNWIVFSVAMVLLLIGLLIQIGRINRRISQSETRYREEAIQRREAQELLAAHKDNLETRVEERTAELAEVNRSLRRSESTLRAIHDITTDPDTNFNAKVEALLREGCQFFQMELAQIEPIWEDPKGGVERVVINGSDSSGQLESIANQLLDELKLSPATMVIRDLDRRCQQRGSANGAGLTGAALATNFQVGEEVAGFILFCNRTPARREFSDVDIDILQLMAQWLGGEIERNEINRRAQEHQAQLAHVARVNTMGEMATGIAHELNQPLTAILNYSNGSLRLLQRSGDDQPELQEAIENVGKDAQRAADIIKRLREFIKRDDLKHERFQLRDCLESAVELLHPRLKELQIEVSIKGFSGQSYVEADRIQIEQVVVNLLLNAIDALQEAQASKRSIEIRIMRPADEALSVTISNSGPEIRQEVVAHLFDPFFTTKRTGMGMGLSISRSIVESHGGTIEYLLDQRRQSTFRFSLPLT